MKATRSYSNTTNNTPGSGATGAHPQQPVPGPTNPGPPISMKKALAKKPYRSKGTNSPGLIK